MGGTSMNLGHAGRIRRMYARTRTAQVSAAASCAAVAAMAMAAASSSCSSRTAGGSSGPRVLGFGILSLMGSNSITVRRVGLGCSNEWDKEGRQTGAGPGPCPPHRPKTEIGDACTWLCVSEVYPVRSSPP